MGSCVVEDSVGQFRLTSQRERLAPEPHPELGEEVFYEDELRLGLRVFDRGGGQAQSDDLLVVRRHIEMFLLHGAGPSGSTSESVPLDFPSPRYGRVGTAGESTSPAVPVERAARVVRAVGHGPRVDLGGGAGRRGLRGEGGCGPGLSALGATASGQAGWPTPGTGPCAPNAPSSATVGMMCGLRSYSRSRCSSHVPVLPCRCRTGTGGQGTP